MIFFDDLLPFVTVFVVFLIFLARATSASFGMPARRDAAAAGAIAITAVPRRRTSLSWVNRSSCWY